MVTLPKNLTATIYPGYFWDVTNKDLYSIKTGTLKKIKKNITNKYTKHLCYKYYFNISHKGKSKIFTDGYLESLTLQDSIIPIKRN